MKLNVISIFTLLVIFTILLTIFPLALSTSESMDVFASATSSPPPATAELTIQEAKPAPKYSALTLDGKLTSLEEFRGNPALVNVWAT
jgi:hypothetical protein